MNCFMKKPSVSNEVIFALWMNEVLTLPYPFVLKLKWETTYLFPVKTTVKGNVNFKNQSLINYHTVSPHSSSGVNLTPYSGVIFGGSYFNSKKELKNSFSGVKLTPDVEELK